MGLFSEIGKLPYSIALGVSQGLVKPKLWARNSYVLGTLNPGKSDLDLTAWFEQEPNSKEIKALVSRLGLIKKLMPFLGEVNVYSKNQVEDLQVVMNCFELERDPSLKKILSLKAVASKEAQASAFILRMIEGDIRNILENPKSRKDKWESHVKMVSDAVSRLLSPIWKDFPERSLLRALIEIGVQLACLESEKKEHLAVATLEHYFECYGRNVPLHTLEKHDLLWSFLPHRYCFFKKDSFDLSEKETEVFKAQVAWELWGMLGQSRISENKKATEEHLVLLEKLMKTVLNDTQSQSQLFRVLVNLKANM